MTFVYFFRSFVRLCVLVSLPPGHKVSELAKEQKIHNGEQYENEFCDESCGPR